MQIKRGPEIPPPLIQRAGWYHFHHAACNENLVGLIVSFQLGNWDLPASLSFPFPFFLIFAFSISPIFSPLFSIDHPRSMPVSIHGFFSTSSVLAYQSCFLFDLPNLQRGSLFFLLKSLAI